MECTAAHFFNPLAGKSIDPFWSFLELSGPMSALALVELWSLTSSPGVKISIRVYGSTVVVSARNLYKVLAFQAFHFVCIIKITGQVRFVKHVGATKLVNLAIL
jgi:hypothetical protein